MSRTITAMFDSRHEAESARERLSASNIEADRVRIVDQQSGGSSSDGSSGQEGFWASLKDMFMPDEDRHAYGEGIRRGGFMLVAEVDESDADRACQTLDQSSSVDFEERQNEWRSQGWADYQADPQTGAFGRLSGDDDRASMDRRPERDMDEQRIPIAHEELRVGKRDVERGGARVRSYVREVPVHEQVNLHEEHVSVERRPVSGKSNLGGHDAFQDREIEMTEHSEEAVIGKETRVDEEVALRKTSEDRTENIDDTVRRTEVDIDEDDSAFGFDRDKDRADKSRSDLERSSTSRNRDDGLL